MRKFRLMMIMYIWCVGGEDGDDVEQSLESAVQKEQREIQRQLKGLARETHELVQETAGLLVDRALVATLAGLGLHRKHRVPIYSSNTLEHEGGNTSARHTQPTLPPKPQPLPVAQE